MKIIVFGSTGGVGSATVRELKAREHDVFLVGRDAAKVDAQRGETGCSGALVGEGGSIADAFDAAKAAMDGIDGVVSCVGGFPMSPIDRLDEAATNRDVAEQVRVALSIVVGAKKHVARGGSVVFLSSVVTGRGAPSHVSIGAAKGAIEGMAKSAAAEMAKAGVRVNTLALGLTRTEATKKVWGKDGAAERLAPVYPLGINEVADVAKAVAFLVETPGITAQTIVMDGGFSGVYSP